MNSAYYIAVGVLDTMEEGESASDDPKSPNGPHLLGK